MLPPFVHNAVFNEQTKVFLERYWFKLLEVGVPPFTEVLPISDWSHTVTAIIVLLAWIVLIAKLVDLLPSDSIGEPVRCPLSKIINFVGLLVFELSKTAPALLFKYIFS